MKTQDSDLYNNEPLAFALDLFQGCATHLAVSCCLHTSFKSPFSKIRQEKNGGGSGLMKLTHYSLITLAVTTD